MHQTASRRNDATAFRAIGDVIREQGFTVPEADERALSTDIQSQIAQLPTAIATVEDCVRAKETVVALKRMQKKVTDFFRDIKEQAHKAHAAICQKERDQLKPLTDAASRLDRMIGSFEAEQRRIKAEREREEQERIRKQQEADALAAAEAIAAESPEMADQILEQAIAAPPPTAILPAVETQVDGYGRIENWQFRYYNASEGQTWKDLTDAQKLQVMAMLPRAFLMPDESKILKQAKLSQGSLTSVVPGVVAYDKGGSRVR